MIRTMPLIAVALGAAVAWSSTTNAQEETPKKPTMKRVVAVTLSGFG